MMNVFYLRLSLASLLAPNAAAATQTQSDVIIIGAGAAGMSAAKTLLARDPSLAITILEATDRIGGRVKTVQLGDTRVEMGAEEHYGQDGGNPVYDALTKKYPGIYREKGWDGSTVYAMPPYSPGGALGTCGTVSYGTQTGLSNNCADDPDWTTFIRIWPWSYVSHHRK